MTPFPHPILLDFTDHIETSRLLIRAPQAGDGALVNAGICETIDDLRPWMPWAQTAPTPDETELKMREGQRKWLERTDLPMLMFLKTSGEFVGGSGLHRIDWNVPLMEIGYWQRTSSCGQGLMTEAVRAIAAFGLEELKAQRLEIRCDTQNGPSRRVAERAGFTLEATLRHNARDTSGELRDTLIFARFPINHQE